MMPRSSTPIASASGPAGRPTPSTIRGRHGVSSSDSAAGDRHVSHTPTVAATPTEAMTTIAVSTGPTITRYT
jgi:hypothetical protein